MAWRSSYPASFSASTSAPGSRPADFVKDGSGEKKSPQTITVVVEGLSSKPLTADRARDMMTISQENFETALRAIRNIVDEEITEAARHHKGEVVYRVPASLYGYDHYNIDHMGRRLAKELHKDGFSVDGSTRMFTISWGIGYELPLTRKLLAYRDRFGLKM